MDTQQNQDKKHTDKKGGVAKTAGAWMIVIGFILFGISINEFFSKNKVLEKASKNIASAATDGQLTEELEDQVTPANGYEINATWGNIGPNLIESGAIDSVKFKQLYEQEGGLNPDQLAILEKWSDAKIKITRENSRFVLNMLWAFGLAQQNKLLTEGDMMKYEDYGRFASTGGWTIASKPIEEIYSKFNWLNLTGAQEEKIKETASNVYRPCCDNSTAFPDCNHGMAALGLIEIMVANNNSAEEIYDALKYFNSFWFTSSYLETAIYFSQIKNIDWDQADSKEVLSKKYSSASGWAKNIHAELEKNPELLPKTTNGGSCGV